MSIDVPLDLYRIFCTVVKSGNMSTAARELFISQPAVSMSIHQLEDRLGKPLLIRSPRGVTATAEGKVLYDHLVQALNLIATAERKYLELLNLEAGEIKISASDTILGKFLLPYIEQFIEMHTGINFKISNKTTAETISMLKNGSADVGFVNMPIDLDDSLEVRKCMEIHDCLIGSQKYAGLAEEGINIKDLPKYPLMLLQQDSSSRRFFDKYAIENGIAPSPVIELGSVDLLEKFAKIGMGLSVVTREFTDSRTDGKELFEIPLHPPIPPRHVGMIRVKKSAYSYAAGSFVDYVVSNTKEMMRIEEK